MHGFNITGATVLVSPRRSVSRHRDNSSSSSSSSSSRSSRTGTVVTSRQFSFSHKLNSTCQFSRPAELDGALEMVRSDLADLRREMVGFISNILGGI